MNISNMIPAKVGKKWPQIQYTIIENTTNTKPDKFNIVYEVNPPKLKSVGKINTLFEMHDLMSRSMEIIAPCQTLDNPISDNIVYQDNGDIIQSITKHGVYFSPDFPGFLLPKDTPSDYNSPPQTIQNAITWGVVRTEPGTVSNDPPFRGTQEIHPRVREFVTYFGSSGKKHVVGVNNTITKFSDDNLAYIKVKAQVFDHLVQYNIWSKSNYEVERLTEWFTGTYMDEYIGMFREAGIVNMYFNRRVRDDTIMAMKNGYHVRSVLYYIRTERVKPEYIGPINQINLNINVESLQKYINDEDRNIESDYDNVLSRWIKKNQLGG